MKGACTIVAAGVVILAACALWAWSSSADAEARHQVELAQHRHKIDSLVDLSNRFRLQAEAYVIIATRERRTADSLRGIDHQTFTHAADIALRDAGLDSLRNVLLAKP